MEEILQLKELLLKGDIQGSLAIVNELEEMSRDDIINNIRSYAVILLIHIIKQQAEHRTTRSWDVSIRNSILEIRAKNKRRKSGGVYLPPEELLNTLKEAYPQAINKASLEVEEGRFEPEQLEQLVGRDEMLNQAMQLILTEN
ncbi:DUF29 family protein [Capilliphycus salinus ALCB114379]|uniref:DUF29 family protein n=1 Tax=Capilliphycus salinus TaxID=2768948 RepID=UPI0039A498FD